MATNLNFNADSKSNLASYTTAGEVVFTEDNIYLVKNDGSKIKYSSIEVVPSLPSSGISSDKIYILSTQNYSINYYDGSAWHVLGSNQIIIGTTNADTTKLWLDISTPTNPILKWYSGTAWINVNNQRNFTTNKIDLTSEVTGILPIVNVNTTTLAKTTDIPNVSNKLEATNIKAGTNINLSTSGNDVTISVSGSNATSINSHAVDNSTYSPNRVLIVDNSGNYTHANVNVAGIVATNGTILQPSGSPTTILSGEEKTFSYPSCSADKMLMNIQEVISGSSVTDNHLDFSDSSKYTSQDVSKILISSNKAQLKSQSDNNVTPTLTGYNTSVSGKTYIVTDNGSITGYESWKTYINTGLIGSYQWASSFTGSNYSQIDYGVGNERYFNRIDIGIYANSGNAKTVIIYGLKTDGTLTGTLTTCNLTNTSSYQTFYFSYVDKLRGIRLVVTDKYALDANFRIMGVQLFTNNYPIIPQYLKTTGSSNFSLTTTDTITSLSMPVVIPTNTNVKCLFSVDNGVNWLYKDGTGFHKYTGDLTVTWTSSNVNTELQTYFTNLPVTQLKSDLNSLSIIPISLDFAWDMSTSDLMVTPTISPVTLIYTTLPHNEFASYGRYDENVTFGVKIIRDPNDNTKTNQMAIKNLSNRNRTANPNVIVTTS